MRGILLIGRGRRRRIAWSAAALFALLIGCGSADSPIDDPAPPPAEQTWFDSTSVDWLLEPVREQLDAGAFPGAAIAFGVRDDEMHLTELGRIGWGPNAADVDASTTIYDLASLTKVLATAAAVMLLVDDGRLALDDPVARYLPAFAEGPKAAVTIRHLLTHTSGLPEGAELRAGSTRAEKIERATRFPILPPAGSRVVYSDVGFIIAWEVAERVAGEPLPDFLRKRLYEPLGMTATGFLPGLDCEECAPTGRLRDQSLYRGRPFDPLAQRLDGISGSAGLFATGRDVGRFAAMIANGGELEGVRILSPATTAEFIGPQPVGGRYRLGWETMCDGEVPASTPCETTIGIGHTGWTGTSIWIDPATGVWTVLLTNRTYESRAPNQLQAVRRELFARARQGRPSAGRTIPEHPASGIDSAGEAASGTPGS